MITSSESSPVTQRKVEPYVYRSLRDGLHDAPEPAEPLPPPPPPGISEEEVQRRELLALERGRREVEARSRTELQQAVQAEREAISAAIQEFERQRAVYYQGIEKEIVQLSLAIARKVLQRESEIDPLLLSGVIRVALDRLSRETTVQLRVPHGDLPRWQHFFEAQRLLAVKPALVPDGSLATGQCRLETELGDTDLSVEVQMQEVEQAFASLLARRTGPDA